MTLRQYISGWVERLSLRRPEFNGLPACPYAGKAKISACTVDDWLGLDALLDVIYLDAWHVLVIKVIDPTSVHVVLEARKKALSDVDIVALVSDPRNPVHIAGYQTTQTEHFLVIMQRQQELKNASAHIAGRGYYLNWPPDLCTHYAHIYSQIPG